MTSVGSLVLAMTNIGSFTSLISTMVTLGLFMVLVFAMVNLGLIGVDDRPEWSILAHLHPLWSQWPTLARILSRLSTHDFIFNLLRWSVLSRWCL